MKEFKGGLETAKGLTDMLWAAAMVMAAWIMATWRDLWTRPQQTPDRVDVTHGKGDGMPTYASLGLPEPRTVWNDKAMRQAAQKAAQERLAPIERARAEAHYAVRYVRRKLDLDGRRRHGPHPYARKLSPEMVAALNSLDSDEAYTLAQGTATQAVRSLGDLRQRGEAVLAEVPPLAIPNAVPPAAPPPAGMESGTGPESQPVVADLDAFGDVGQGIVPPDFGSPSITPPKK